MITIALAACSSSVDKCSEGGHPWRPGTACRATAPGTRRRRHAHFLIPDLGRHHHHGYVRQTRTAAGYLRSVGLSGSFWGL
jgi:hypothetical protein